MRVLPVEEGAVVDLGGHVLVLPGCGGLRHVGGLCVDAVISSLGLRRVAVIESRNLLPMASASAWAEPGKAGAPAAGITTAAELYQGPSAPGLTVVQLRSAAADGRRRALAEELLAWARDEGVEEILLLASCSSHVKVDADFSAGTNLRFLRIAPGAADDTAAFSPPPRKPGLAVDPAVPLLRAHPPPKQPRVDESGEVVPPEEEPQPPPAELVELLVSGGGLAKPLLQLAGQSAKAPGVLCLLGFASEAFDPLIVEQLARAALASVAGLLPGAQAPPLEVPPSWRMQLAEQAFLEQRRLFA